VDSRRAGGAVPAAPPAGRAERIRQQREAAPKGKNPLPLVASLVGILAIGGAVAYALSRGGDEQGKRTPAPLDPARGGGGGTAGKGGAGGPETEGAPKPFAAMTPADQTAYVESRVSRAKSSPSAAREAHDELKRLGREADAKRAMEAGHEAFPEDAEISKALGLRDKGAEIRKVVDDEVTEDRCADLEAFKGLKRLHARILKNPGAAWVDEATAKQLDEWVQACQKEMEYLQDPGNAKTRQLYGNIKNDSRFTGMDFSTADARPYVLFAETPSAARKEQTDALVAHRGKVLQCLQRRFVQFLREEVGIKDAPPLAEINDARLRGFVFKDRESYDAWHVRLGSRSPSFAAAYYDPSATQMIYMYAGLGRSGIPGDKQDEDVNVTFHEGTHQIIHFYARYFTQQEDDAIADKEGKRREEVLITDSRLHSSFMWFQEGIAEYFGAAEPVPGKDGEWTLGRIQKARTLFFRAMLSQKQEWRIEEFLFRSQSQLEQDCRTKNVTDPEIMKLLIYSQGWTLVHYFLHGDGGKWRAKFLRYCGREFSGHSDQPSFLAAFGLPKRTRTLDMKPDPAWVEFIQDVEKGYREYSKSL